MINNRLGYLENPRSSRGRGEINCVGSIFYCEGDGEEGLYGMLTLRTDGEQGPGYNAHLISHICPLSHALGVCDEWAPHGALNELVQVCCA